MALVVLVVIAGWTLARANEARARFTVWEGRSKYDFVPVVAENTGNALLKGFNVFDAGGRLIQFIPHEQDLSSKVADYITGGVEGAPPVKFLDCNFDGCPDAMMRDDVSPRYESFEIWTWNPKANRFVADAELNAAEINRVDSKARLLYSNGSAGHGDSGCLTYAYRSGKLILVKREMINARDDTDTVTYYRDGKEVKRTVSARAEEDAAQ